MIQGMAKDGILYRGVLYAGLMLTDKGPYVLEYNCRFGDPETQVVLPRMKSDLLPVMMEIAEGRLKTEFLDWHSKACLSIVIASGGYPGHYDKGVPIQGLETLKSVPDLFVFHAGTVKRDSETVTDGGRVLAVTALGETMREAHDRAYQNVGKIQCSHSFYRRDIGRRAAEVLQ